MENVEPKKEEIVVPPVPQPADEFSIEQLFGSKTRVRLLALFLEDPDRAFYVRELTRRIDAQLNSVRRELKNLVDMEIILEVEGKILKEEAEKQKVEKKKYYRANTKFIFFDELRSIMKKSSVLMHKSVVRELANKGTIDLLFMTGKFVDDSQVPTDLLVVGAIDVKVLQTAIHEFEQKIGWEINYTYMPKEEFIYRREVKDRFLASIMNAQKLMLIDKVGDV